MVNSKCNNSHIIKTDCNSVLNNPKGPPFLAHQIGVPAVFTHMRSFIPHTPYQPVGPNEEPHVGKQETLLSRFSPSSTLILTEDARDAYAAVPKSVIRNFLI